MKDSMLATLKIMGVNLHKRRDHTVTHQSSKRSPETRAIVAQGASGSIEFTSYGRCFEEKLLSKVFRA